MSTFVLRHNPATAVLSNWFDRMLSDSQTETDRDSAAYRMQPRMDIAEEEDKYYVTVDIPGLSKEDVGIKIENGVIKIEGERREERKGGKYHHAERAYGKFMRIFSMPDDVDAEGIAAKVQNGVLELQLPKNKNAQPREIKIA